MFTPDAQALVAEIESDTSMASFKCKTNTFSRLVPPYLATEGSRRKVQSEETSLNSASTLSTIRAAPALRARKKSADYPGSVPEQ